MRTYKKHIVAFLDILGFKNMINTKAFDDIRDIFRSIIPQEDLSFALGRAADDSDYDLNPPVFLRGAVAEGDFYLDENLIFGKALVDAYLAQRRGRLLLY